MNIIIIKKNIIWVLGGIIIGVALLLRGIIHFQGFQYKRISLILPHFIIAPAKLDTVRSEVSEDIETQEPTIIIISPDHFNTYNTNNLVYDTSINSVCVQGYCQQAQGAWIARKSSSYTITNHTLILPDHGIGAHLRFIKKRLPKAKIIPLLLQPRSIANSENIITTIHKISKKQPTIIIGSVDRSHYVPEPWANLHDSTTRSILSSHDPDRNNRSKLDVDCPSCLWTIDHITQYDNQSPKLLWRDSSATLFGTTGRDNTSRGIISYVSTENEIISNNSKINIIETSLTTGVTLLIGGDIMYDRGVQKKLPDTQSLAQHFREWYELADVRKNPLFSFHRLGAGIDIVMVNLETPLYRSGSICYVNQKPYSFCSHETILNTLSNIGINTISFDNNHRFDAGTEQYLMSKNIIKEHHMDIASDDEILKKNIRGILIAIHAYDFTVPDQKDILQKACTETQESAQEGYKPIISVHRGEEYQKIATAGQKNIAKKLISCGAKAIVGHHPHVIQQIEWIDNTPIVYSLGNFLMDQGFSSETSTGMIIGLVVPKSGDILLFTGGINALP